MLKGVTVTLYEETQTGVDALNAPVYEETPVQIDNVLIAEPSTEDLTSSNAVYQKVVRAMLGIPKGDTHNWQDKHVSWTDRYGVTHHYKTFGFPITGIEENIPGPWHMKVRCEAYG